MSETIITILISSLVSLLGSGLVVWVAAKKAPAEIRGIDADATKTNAEAAIALNEGLVRRVERLEAELAEACEQVEGMKKEISDLRAENTALHNWAERLAHQVQSMGGVPVPLSHKPRLQP